MLSRWIMAAGLIILIAGAAWIGLPDARTQVAEGKPALQFTLPDLAGKLQALPEGKVVLLNFWATWCPPCRQEMPSMAALSRRLESKGLKVVAVSVDKSASDLASFVREYKLPFMVLHDADAATSASYGVFRYPESFLIDRNGVVRYHLIGAVDWMSPQVLQGIEGMLNEQSGKAG